MFHPSKNKPLSSLQLITLSNEEKFENIFVFITEIYCGHSGTEEARLLILNRTESLSIESFSNFLTSTGIFGPIKKKTRGRWIGLDLTLVPGTRRKETDMIFE